MGSGCIISHNAPAKRKTQNSLPDAFSRALSSCRSPITLQASMYRAGNCIVGTISQTPMAQTQPFSNFHFSGL